MGENPNFNENFDSVSKKCGDPGVKCIDFNKLITEDKNKSFDTSKISTEVLNTLDNYLDISNSNNNGKKGVSLKAKDGFEMKYNGTPVYDGFLDGHTKNVNIKYITKGLKEDMANTQITLEIINNDGSIEELEIGPNQITQIRNTLSGRLKN